MKTMLIGVLGLLAVGSFFFVSSAGISGKQPEGAPTPATVPTTYPTSAPSTAPSGDAGTDIVAAFYKALLQETPPTLEQENALFGPESGLRNRLVDAGLGKDKDPVILDFLRNHKELFLPKKMRRLDDVVISGTFNWVRDLVDMKDTPKKGNGYVLVFFNEDAKAAIGQYRPRTIVFSLSDGKIAVGSIWLNGFGSESSLGEFLKVKIPKDKEQPDE